MDRQPFFVLGLGRSGSSLLTRVLSTHSRIALTSEARVADFLYFVTQYGSVPRGEDYRVDYPETARLSGIVPPWEVEHFATFLKERLPGLLEEWYEARFPDLDFTHWGDKMPLPRTAPAIQTAFPEVRFLILVRDPRGYVQSLLDYRRRDDALDLDPRTAELPVERLARDWRNSYREFPRYLRRTHVVRFEDLVTRPREVVRAALRFLDLELEPQMLAPENVGFAEGHATSSSPRDSLDRWRSDLADEDRRSVEAICGEVMEGFGYRREPAVSRPGRTPGRPRSP